jgi:hypothetical protein
MSLLVAEGFGWLDTGSHNFDAAPILLASGQWAGPVEDYTISAYATGRQLMTGGDIQLKTRGFAEQTTIVVGMRLVQSGIWDYSGLVCLFMNGGEVLGSLTVQNDGRLHYEIGSTGAGGSFIVASSNQTLTAPGETFIEAEIYFHNSAGTVKMWMNGVQVCDASSLDTIKAGVAATGTTVIQVDGYSLYNGMNSDTKWTDFYVDTANRHGDVKIETAHCTIAGTDSDWTPLASTNISQVDESGDADEDVSYNSSSTQGDRDGYKCAAMSDIGDIVAVVHQVRVRKEDAFAGYFKIGALYNGSETQSADKSCAAGYEEAVEIFETNPDTAAAWLAAQLATTELTIENNTP